MKHRSVFYLLALHGLCILASGAVLGVGIALKDPLGLICGAVGAVLTYPAVWRKALGL